MNEYNFFFQKSASKLKQLCRISRRENSEKSCKTNSEINEPHAKLVCKKYYYITYITYYYYYITYYYYS